MKPPKKIVYHKKSRTLEVLFDDEDVLIPAELLRVYSPSAEVRGHGSGQRKLETGKKYVNVRHVEAVGNYAIRLTFDDGHDSGIYAWEYLRDLGENQDSYWQAYLADLKAANASRLPTIPVGQWDPKA
jgi:DUF971 family protein